MVKEYLIHDNGGRPFRVTIRPKKKLFEVKVYTLGGIDEDDYDEDDDKNFEWVYEKVPILTFTANKVFIGESTLDEYGSTNKGNTILVHERDLDYVCITTNIYRFTAQAEIIEFESPIYGSDVSYPYALDVLDNYYLLIEDVYFKKTEIIYDDESEIDEEFLTDNYEDPYQYYYLSQQITANEKCIPPRQPLIENFQDIDRYYIGNKLNTLCYHCHPETNYDWSTKNSTEEMSIINIREGKIVLTKESYKKLMEDFGERMGYSVIKGITILQERLD